MTEEPPADLWRNYLLIIGVTLLGAFLSSLFALAVLLIAPPTSHYSTGPYTEAFGMDKEALREAVPIAMTLGAFCGALVMTYCVALAAAAIQLRPRYTGELNDTGDSWLITESPVNILRNYTYILGAALATSAAGALVIVIVFLITPQPNVNGAVWVHRVCDAAGMGMVAGASFGAVVMAFCLLLRVLAVWFCPSGIEKYWARDRWMLERERLEREEEGAPSTR